MTPQVELVRMLGDINSECYIAPLKVYPVRMLGDVIGLTGECVKLERFLALQEYHPVTMYVT